MTQYLVTAEFLVEALTVREAADEAFDRIEEVTVLKVKDVDTSRVSVVNLADGTVWTEIPTDRKRRAALRAALQEAGYSRTHYTDLAQDTSYSETWVSPLGEITIDWSPTVV